MKAPARLDHLVYAAPELDAAVDHVRDRLGVSPVPGGSHPRWGTRNALVGLGPGRYLEVIAPDPGLPDPEGPRPFGVDDLTEPRLATWALKSRAPKADARAVRAAGFDLGPVRSGTRRRPDGTGLSWMLTDPAAERAGGVIPFLIEWADGAHPSETLEHPVELLGLDAAHPEPERIRSALGALGADLDLTPGPRPALRARLRCPAGQVELR